MTLDPKTTGWHTTSDSASGIAHFWREEPGPLRRSLCGRTASPVAMQDFSQTIKRCELCNSKHTMPDHPSFKFPRLPPQRLVQVHWVMSDRPARDFAGLFWTSGVENVGEDSELYLLRRVAAPDSPVEILKVPRRWQENGGLSVLAVTQDLDYMPLKTS